ncbi:MAG: ribonuclease HI family protein [Actinobacteria bacterium]|nr:ribonuclease HI family protein [Actinomycetota bacterium]
MPGTWVLYTDGASRGNPGPASIGAVLYSWTEGEPLVEVDRVSEAIGEATNNVAEYTAVIAGLEMARAHEPEFLWLRADSQLLIRQLEGRYRVKNVALVDLHRRARALLDEIPHQLEHVPRQENTVADRLANLALDLR